MAIVSPSARRALVRSYKEAPPAPGVYLIRNLADGRVLVAAGSNPEAALNRHRFELQRVQHRNPMLQADWSRLGAEAFRFEVVDRIRPSDDPAFDAAAELAALLAMWREDLCAGAPTYPLRGDNPFA